LGERDIEREISRGGFLERDFERVGMARWCSSTEGMLDGGAVKRSVRERERERERERSLKWIASSGSYPF
jgi:hypothetical protein